MPVTPKKPPIEIDMPSELLACLSPVPQRLTDLADRINVTSGTVEVVNLIRRLQHRGFAVVVERSADATQKHHKSARIERHGWPAALAAAEAYCLAAG